MPFRAGSGQQALSSLVVADEVSEFQKPRRRRALSKGQVFFLALFAICGGCWALVTLFFIGDPYFGADPNSARGQDNLEALLNGRLLAEVGTFLSLGGMIAASMVKPSSD